MSENTQVQQDATAADQSINAEQVNETETKDYTAEQLAQRLKVVNQEARDNRKRLQEEKRKREELEKQSLAEKGQYKELADVWQRKAKEAEDLASKLKEAFAVKSVSDSVISEARSLGCVDPEALINLVNLNELPLDENFNVDRSHVKVVLEDMKKQKPYFFKQAALKVPDATPAKSEAPTQDLSKMSVFERAALLSQLKKQGK